MDSPREERLFRGQGGRMLLALSLGNATIALGTLVLSPLLPTLIDSLEISPLAAGVALSVMWGLNATGQFPGGRLSDQLTRKTLLVSGLSGLTVGFAILSVSPTFLVFLLGTALVGLSSGLFPSTAYATLSDLFDAKRGRAFGLYTAHWDLGGTLAAGLAVAVLATLTWRAAFLPVIALSVGVALLVHHFSDEPYRVSRVSLDVRGTGRRLLGDGHVRLVLLAYSLYLFTWQGAVSFLPTLLQVERGFSPALAGGGFAVLFAVGIVVKPLSGTVGDRLGRTRTAFGALVTGTVGLAMLLLAPSAPLIVVGIVVFAIGLMAFSPPMLAYVMSLFPTASAGGDFGAVRTIYLGIGSLGPTYVGLVASVASYTLAFTGLVCALGASALLLGGITRQSS
jgi:predicted MFS family arabinose efflux permease